ncbi:hypothetical protein HLB23_00020 [Nocardia uniformis]|uniref:Uncharacterized protein n=1 Tax=Nocardia uniformis TaxID=53432 RepID=A0A849C5M7_9NOCA|nr:hypothetical protein [Nocardia uniformis]NNH68281.1 hypothetical protein [Nocardia uniformis]
MCALRGIFVGALIGAATLIGGGAAMAAPLPLESHTAAAESVATPDCSGVIHPLQRMTCLLSSLSG